jgi:mRNA interferase MazF
VGGRRPPALLRVRIPDRVTCNHLRGLAHGDECEQEAELARQGAELSPTHARARAQAGSDLGSGHPHGGLRHRGPPSIPGRRRKHPCRRGPEFHRRDFRRGRGMGRGEVWTVSAGGYAGKPRPAVIVQDDRFDATASITVCVLTTDPTNAPLFRLPVSPTEANGLRTASRLMVDKITTVPKERIGEQIGHLDTADVVRLNRAILVFLGLA